MRVAVVMAAGSSHLSGVTRHGVNLVRSLLARPEIDSVDLIADNRQLGFLRCITGCSDRLHVHTDHIGESSIPRNLWYIRTLPGLLSKLDCTVVHLTYPVPIRRTRLRLPLVVTLHDLYPIDLPENFGFPKVLFNRMILTQCLRNADSVACVSQCTMNRLERICPIVSLAKAKVVPNAVEAWPADGPLEAVEHLLNCPFVLCVAQHRRNKNIPLLLRVFHRLRTVPRFAQVKLLVIGIPGPETRIIRDAVRDLGLTGYVLFFAGLSEPALHWCYRHCEAVVAPSTLEGFGLPVVEALMAGARVVCSDIPAFREVGNSCCRFVSLDADPVERFARAIMDALASGKPSSAQMPQLSLSEVGARYVQLYRSLSSPALVPQLTTHLPGIRTRKLTR